MQGKQEVQPDVMKGIRNEVILSRNAELRPIRLMDKGGTGIDETLFQSDIQHRMFSVCSAIFSIACHYQLSSRWRTNIPNCVNHSTQTPGAGNCQTSHMITVNVQLYRMQRQMVLSGQTNMHSVHSLCTSMYFTLPGRFKVRDRRLSSSEQAGHLCLSPKPVLWNKKYCYVSHDVQLIVLT